LITDLGQNVDLEVNRGKTIIIPAAVEQYRIKGNAILYKAAVPV
jgi:mannose-6-phosphate isomerase class I